MRMGVTGSRVEPTRRQTLKLAAFINAYEPEELHHGVCVGADEMAHQLCVGMGVGIVLHPPLNTKLCFDPNRYDTDQILRVEEPAPYMKRNEEIVAMSRVVIGLPSGKEVDQPRSGTWATIRRADKVHKLVALIWPDGSVTLS